MRNPLRLIAPVVAVVALVLGGASSALAAAQPSSASLDEAWCFQDITIQYCFDVTGTVKFLDNKAGSTVNIHAITETTVTESGVYVGESRSVEYLRGVFQADGTVVLQSLIHTRASFGDQTCSYHMVLRIADYEAVVDNVNSTCGG